MTLPIETAGVKDEYARRALDVVAQQFPVGPAQLMARSGTALPASPVDGMETYYTADDTNGVIWHFRYRSAASSSRWEFVGGPPLRSEVDTSEARNNAAYGALTTAGPSVTCPLAGDYIVRIGSAIGPTGAGFGIHSFDVGGTAASDNDMIMFVSTGAQEAAVAREQVVSGVAAGTALVSKYRSTVNTNFRFRWMTVTPIRVG